VVSYFDCSLAEEDTFPVNPYNDSRPDVPEVVAHLKAREVTAKAGHRARLGHHDIPAMPRRFYVHLRRNDLTALPLPPRIVPVVAEQLKVSTHASMITPKGRGSS
jgi:hypothetical protein